MSFVYFSAFLFYSRLKELEEQYARDKEESEKRFEKQRMVRTSVKQINLGGGGQRILKKRVTKEFSAYSIVGYTVVPLF